ncbi:MAG TPA: hypothetical protein VN260_09145 [Dissulfurispiraceae bacterium]|nr:hypothetical protein [Dissulfurispiraceae bacterium]
MRKPLIAIVILCLFAVSCGKKEVKKTVSEDSRVATEAMQVVEKLREAYTAKDLHAIERVTTRDGFNLIRGSIKNFDRVDLQFNPVLVEIESGTANVNVSWKGTWSREGKTTEERGMTVFVLKVRPLRVDNIMRSNPFSYPQ